MKVFLLGLCAPGLIVSTAWSAEVVPSASASSVVLKPAPKNSKNSHWIQLWQTMRKKKSLPPVNLQSGPPEPGVVESSSCEAARALLTEEKFPLRSFARIFSQIECEPSKKMTAEDWRPGPPPDDEAPWKLDILNRKYSTTPTFEDDFATYKLRWALSPTVREKEEALLQLIDLLRKQGQPEALLAWEEKLWQISPSLRPMKNPSEDQWLVLANDYRVHLKYSQAIRYYKKLLRPKTLPLENRWDLLRQLQKTYKLAGNKKEMLKTSSKLSRWTETTLLKNPTQIWVDRYIESQLSHAYALWTAESRIEAERVAKKTRKFLRRLAGVKKDLNFSDAEADLDYLAGRIQQQGRHYTSALKNYEAALQRNPEPKLREKVAWAKAWLQYLQGQYELAAASFAEMVQKTEETSSILPDYEMQKWRATFWRARSLEKIQKDSGKTLFQTLLENDSLGYYGMLAQRELGLPFAPIKSPLKTQPWTEAKTEAEARTNFDLGPLQGLKTPSDILSGIEWSLLLEEPLALKIYLGRLKSFLTPIDHKPLEIQVAFIKLEAMAGFYLPAFSAAPGLDLKNRHDFLNESALLLFPIYKPEFVEEVTKKYSFSSSLVYAIARQESGFDPLARSHADALGLMQLLPSRAASQARSLGLAMKDPLQLYDPEFNIQIGAQELHRLLLFWKGEYIPAIASYNAGENPVKGWLRSRFREDPLEFIEEIPYSETRTYVKLVLRNYLFYERIRKSEAFLFAENLLKLSPLTHGRSKKKTK